MSEDTPPPLPKTASKTRGLVAAAFSQNFHAILVGVFTMASSVISALLGYYFAHEDRRSMMALEYDKLRAEHTLEIAKSLTGAEASMIQMNVAGSTAAAAYCDVANRLAALKTDLAKVKPVTPVHGTLNEVLAGLDAQIQAVRAPENVRQELFARLRAMKSDHTEMDKLILDSWKRNDETRERLTGDTSATLRVYHRESTDRFMQMMLVFFEVDRAMRTLVLENPDCNLKTKWEAVGSRVAAWNSDATLFSESLGIALKPE